MEHWNDAAVVLLSALEHWAYCPRQCALIHLEQTFDENIYTLRGRMEHERVHEEAAECQEGVRVERGIWLWSRRLGLVGKADVVEFREGTPYPVEYKHGVRRHRLAADLQLCGQAICLEEMIGQPVPKGAIYHQGSRRRREVVFTDELRSQVEQAADDIRRMMASGRLPPPVNDRRCDDCSLRESCMPAVVASPGRVRAAQATLFQTGDGAPEPSTRHGPGKGVAG